MPGSFIFDRDLCTGCSACALACTMENDLEPGSTWRSVETFNDRRHPAAPLFHISLACNHCADAACMRACPALAIARDPVTGAVLIDADLCVGCRYCGWACPFDAPRFNAVDGLMEKCTFCAPRLREGGEPACVISCPTGALRFGEMREEEIVNRSEGFPETELAPRIHFDRLRNRGAPPECTDPPELPFLDRSEPSSKVTSSGEWPLALFTLIAAVLVAVYTNTLVRIVPVEPVSFLAAGLAALVVSAIHLGRKGRAHRAVRNVARSWLSREVLLFTLFIVAVTVESIVWPVPGEARWFIALTGFAALFSIDRVYRAVALAPPARPHSAEVTLTALLLAGVLGEIPLVAGSAALLKLAFAVARHGRGIFRPAHLIRVGIGLLLPAILWFLPGEPARVALIASLVLGETIDRFRFYDDVEIVTPPGAMRTDLAKRLG